MYAWYPHNIYFKANFTRGMISHKRHRDQFSPAHQNTNHCTLPSESKLPHCLILGSLERCGSAERCRASPPHLLAGQHGQSQSESAPLCAGTRAPTAPPGHRSSTSDEHQWPEWPVTRAATATRGICTNPHSLLTLWFPTLLAQDFKRMYNY